MNLTDEFIQHIYTLSSTKNVVDYKHSVRRCLLDYLGVSFAGAKMMSDKINSFHSQYGIGKAECSILGTNFKTTCESAIFFNGLVSHVSELDDGVRFGGVHPGSPVFSALLPVAQLNKIDFGSFARGVLVGYETTVKLANAIHPHHYSKGYHPTGTCGSIGAATGLAAMLDLSISDFKTTFSAAAISASGSLKVIEGASDMKPINVAKAALDGYKSMQISQMNFEGPEDVLSGSTGFFKIMSGVHKNPQFAESLFSDEQGINQIYVKPYAACRHAHAPIEASLILKDAIESRIDLIDHIEVQTYHSIIGKHDHTIIQGVSSAKMSIPYGVAVALTQGSASIFDYSNEKTEDDMILSLAKKVRVIANEEITSLLPKMRASIVTIYFLDGSEFSERVNLPKGEPETKLSDVELKEKYRLLSRFNEKTQGIAQKVEDAVWQESVNMDYLYSLI